MQIPFNFASTHVPTVPVPLFALSRLILRQVLIVVVVIVAVIPAVCFCRFCCCYKIHELFLLLLPLLLLPLFYFTHIFLFCHFLLFHWPSGGVGGNYGATNCVLVCVWVVEGEVMWRVYSYSAVVFIRCWQLFIFYNLKCRWGNCNWHGHCIQQRLKQGCEHLLSPILEVAAG